MSIRLKITLIAGLCLLLTIITSVALNLNMVRGTIEDVNDRVSAMQEADALEILTRSAAEQSRIVQSVFEVALDSNRALAQVFEAVKMKQKEEEDSSRYHLDQRHIKQARLRWQYMSLLESLGDMRTTA